MIEKMFVLIQLENLICQSSTLSSSITGLISVSDYLDNKLQLQHESSSQQSLSHIHNHTHDAKFRCSQ